MEIVIQGVTFSHPITSNQSLTIKYRNMALADAPDNYIPVASNITVLANLETPTTAGNIDPDITISGLSAGTYGVYITNNCSGRTVYKTYTLTDSTPVVYVWIEDTYVCEQDAVFTQTSQITGFSSPQMLMYDSAKQRVYGFDGDNPNGNVFSYNPVGFTSAVQPIYYPSVLQTNASNYMFAAILDPEFRRIYFMGRDSDGIQVFNVADNTITVIPFGLNHNVAPTGTGNGFNRLLMRKVGDYIYATDVYSDKLITIDRSTSLKVGEPVLLSTITSGTSLSGAAEMHSVNGEIWVVESQEGSNNPNILRFTPTFSKLGEIDIAAHSTLWANSRYWRTAYADAEYAKYYVYDSGSNKLIIVDTATTAITVKEMLVRQGKTNSSFGFIEDPTTGELYLSGHYRDSTSDPGAIPITYRLDRATQELTNVYATTVFTNLVKIGATNELHGAAPGGLGWNNTAGWDTDGTITKFTK